LKTWLITGCSSGLGRSLAQAVLAAGYNAVVTARKPETIEDLVSGFPETAVSAALDVTKQDQIAAAVKLAEERFGGIDVLVNNAGYGYRGAVEEGNESDVAELFTSTFFGDVALIKAVLPGMRARRQGTILNVTSIGGRLAMPGSGYYAAAKFAIVGMSDALRKEVGPLGIRVIDVEPGAMRTDFAGRSLKQSKTILDDYAETVGPRRKENDKSHGKQPGDPDRAARVLIRVVESESAPFRLLLGSDAVKIVRAEVESQLQEIDQWKDLSVSTDFPGGS
jgi:NAD(P)-dependent dehydrogenase (short-subunit alcohol dehydrogenase family)